MVSFLKKTRWIVSKIGMRSSFDTASMLLVITFSSYLFEDYFFTFFHFFKVLKKEFFRISSNWVLFTASVTRTILSRFKNNGLYFLLILNNFFCFSEKKTFFPFLTQLFDGKKNLKNSEWLKMVSDGWFELSIVNLVGIKYLKVKTG